MYARVLAVAAATLALGAGPAGASVFLQGGKDIACNAYSCSGVASAPSGGGWIDSLSFDRSLLGDLKNAMVHITFWNAQGEMVGDLGNYLLGVLAGDQLTLKGTGFDLTGLGPLTFKIEKVSMGGGGSGGFGGFGGAPLSFSAPSFSAPSVSAPSFAAAPSLSVGSIAGFSSFTDGGPVRLVATVVTAVPEPASWAMMLLGFAGAGAVLRRRRTAMSVATA